MAFAHYNELVSTDIRRSRSLPTPDAQPAASGASHSACGQILIFESGPLTVCGAAAPKDDQAAASDRWVISFQAIAAN